MISDDDYDDTDYIQELVNNDFLGSILLAVPVQPRISLQWDRFSAIKNMKVLIISLPTTLAVVTFLVNGKQPV